MSLGKKHTKQLVYALKKCNHLGMIELKCSDTYVVQEKSKNVD